MEERGLSLRRDVKQVCWSCRSLIMAVCSLTPDEVIVGYCRSVWGDTNVRMCIRLNSVINHSQKCASSVPSAWLYITRGTDSCWSLLVVLGCGEVDRWTPNWDWRRWNFTSEGVSLHCFYLVRTTEERHESAPYGSSGVIQVSRKPEYQSDLKRCYLECSTCNTFSLLAILEILASKRG